jgi:galactonate dehydratase
VQIQEQILGLGHGPKSEFLNYFVDSSPMEAKNGYIELMTKPGLGVEIDEKAVRAAAKKINRKRFPEWTHKDGSFAEW